MDADDLVMVSVDDHLVEPPNLFEGRLPAKFQDEAPSVTRLPDGSDVWVFNGQTIPNIGLNAVAGRPQGGIRHRTDGVRRDATGMFRRA